MFLELKDKTGEMVLVNTATVEAVYPGNREGDNQSTILQLSAGEMEVLHPYNEVRQMFALVDAPTILPHVPGE